MHNILLAAQLSVFRCKDLLEINSGAEAAPRALTNFKLHKATDEITKIIKLQKRGKKIDFNVNYV